MDEHQQDLVAQFCAVTGGSPSSAQTALTSADWNLEEAVALYFAAQDEPADTNSNNDDFDYQAPVQAPPQPIPTAPAQASSSQASSSRKTTGRPKQMTMDELRKRAEAGSDEDEADKPQDMFAGGEKSGLAVHNPGQDRPPDHFKNIMNQARQNRDRPAAEEAETRSTNFTGRAQTLGGDEAESQVIEDPTAGPRSRPVETVSRTLHLWADGISIDDGPLFRFDDPANQNIMNEINRGRAPLALLDVQPDQEVDLNLEPHKDENYVQPKKVYKPFGGQGQRLGSPTPALAQSTPASTSTAIPAAASSSSAPNPVDTSQPTLQLQIRLGDGTRLTSRFNTTQTIGDVYAFVTSSSPASAQRSFALMTTFPSKELSDRDIVLGEIEEFKKGRGGVVVQKWT